MFTNNASFTLFLIRRSVIRWQQPLKLFLWMCLLGMPLCPAPALRSVAGNEWVQTVNPSPAPGSWENPYQATIQRKSYQTIKGWGLFPALINQDHGKDILTSDALQTALYSDLNIQVMRVEINPGYYDTNGVLDKKRIDQTLVAHIQKARAKNPAIRYITTIWSAPAEWKTCQPPTTKGRCGDVKAIPVVANHLKPAYEDDLIKASAQVIEYLAKEKGLGLPAGHCLQNELTSAVKWNGTVYDKSQYHRMIKAARTYFDSHGLAGVKLMGPEGGNTTDSWEMLGGPALPDLATDTELNAAVNMLISHTYDQWDKPMPTVADLEKFAQTAVQTGKERWMTEWCTVAPTTAANENDKLLEEIEHFSRDLVLGQYNYWFYWLGWRKIPRDDGQTMLWGQDPANPVKTKRYWVYKKLFSSIPPGSVVKHLTTTDPDLKAGQALRIDMVAFDKGSTTVVLLVNPARESRYISINGLEGRTVRKFQTTATEDMAEATSEKTVLVRGACKTQLPARSIVVITTEAG